MVKGVSTHDVDFIGILEGMSGVQRGGGSNNTSEEEEDNVRDSQIHDIYAS